MKRLLRISLFALCLSGLGNLHLYAQQYSKSLSTDSIAEEAANKTAIQLVNEANSNAVSNPVKSMRLATEALDKSIKKGDKAAEYQSYNTLGTLYFNIGNYTKAAEYFKLASDGFASIGDTKNKAFADKYLAEANSKKAALLTATDVTTKNSAVRKNYSKGKSEGYLKYRAKAPDAKPEEKIDIYSELGNACLDRNDTTAAVAYWQQAGSYTLQTDNNSLIQKSEEVGTAFNSTKNYTANIVFQNSVLNEGILRGEPKIVGQASYNLGTTYIEAQKPKDAIPFLMQSIEIASKNGDLVQKQKSIKELSKAYESAGQYDKALKVIKDYVKNLDSIKNVNQRSAEENLALNEEFLKQEKRIQSLIVTQNKKEADIKRQRVFLWGLAGILCVFAVLTYSLFRNIRQKQKANMKIKLQSLRTQMNPHFIFNSLNSVNNFISKNDERSANKYLADFSKLMRTVLKNSDQDFVSLETEIQTLRIYLDLEHFRFGEKFDYTLEVENEIDPQHVEIPPMLIQPYIENAIWHGLRYKEEKGLLTIRFFTEDEKLYCTVQDNGIGRKKSAELKTNNQKNYQSTGIKNTRERIELLNKLHGTQLDISIFDTESGGQSTGTMVKISLPYILQTEPA